MIKPPRGTGSHLALALLLITLLIALHVRESSALVPDMPSTSPVEVLSGDNNYFLKVNLRDSRVQLRVALANNDSGGLQTLAGIKGRFENQGYAEWAIVNGDLFSSNCPGGVNCAQGLTYIDSAPKPNWSAYGNTWTVRGNLGLDLSKNVQISVGGAQSKRHMTIGGGPRVLMGGGIPTCNPIYDSASGKTFFPDSGEWFDDNVTSWCSDPRAITMLGYSGDGQYLYMGISRGGKPVTQLAQWLKDRGAHEILRMDSGGSSGMYHDGQFIGGSYSRPIANAFVLIVEEGPPPPPPPPVGQWHAEYFSNKDLNSRCYDGYKSGTYMFEDWGDGTPAGGCPSENWSARFTRQMHLQTGSYTFALGSDDWGRIKVGNDLVVDNWQGRGQHYEGRYLSEGDYDVTVEFADTLGSAKVAAWWWGPGFDVPRESKDPNRWYVQYWGNRDQWWDSVVRINLGGESPSLDWQSNGPGWGLPNDRFSSRFEKTVYFTCGQYRFDVIADDGVRVWLDGYRFLDEWHSAGQYHPTVDISQGYHELKVEHYEDGGVARLDVSWAPISYCPTPTPTPTPIVTPTKTPTPTPRGTFRNYVPLIKRGLVSSGSTSIPIRADNLDGFEDPTFYISGDGNRNNWVGTTVFVMTGWVFADVQIPRGARVLSSYVRFRGFGNGGGATARIYGFAQDDAPAFVQGGSNRPSTRPITTAFVDWPNTWSFACQWFQTPDLSAIVREIINRPGWVAGNNIGFSVRNPSGVGTNWAVVDYAGGQYSGGNGSGHSVTLYVNYSISSSH